jgi:2,4-didehydro-3-deoxy-L-rhamnonate hydrolase
VPNTAGAATFFLGTFRVDSASAEFAGLVVEDQVLDLSARFPDATVRDLLDVWDDVLPVLAELADSPGGRQDLAPLEVRAPVAPRQVLQAGANYRTHVIDLAVQHSEITAERTVEQVRVEAAAMMDRRAAEGTPYFFIGLPTVIGGPFDDVVLPDYSRKHDWELELAVVIGRRAFRVGRDEALDHVAGYTIVNDLTTRDLVFRQDMPEIGSDWFRAKNAPGFLPTGPFLVPKQFVGDPGDLRVTLLLNGDTMQDESTKDMIFDVPALVAAASETVPLLPGDLILTGSPAGNGIHHGRLLRDGDVMVGTITRGDSLSLGTQRVRTVAP